MTDYRQTAGKTTIAPEVLLTIARLTTLQVPGVSRMAPIQGNVGRMFKKHGQPSQGVLIEVQDDTVYADIHVIMKNDVNVREVSDVIQCDVTRAIEEMVGMVVGRVNVHIEDINYPTETEV